MRRLRIADAISFADFVSQHELGGRFFMLKGSGVTLPTAVLQCSAE